MLSRSEFEEKFRLFLFVAASVSSEQDTGEERRTKGFLCVLCAIQKELLTP